MRYILLITLLTACSQTELVCADTQIQEGVYSGLLYTIQSDAQGTTETTVWENSTVHVNGSQVRFGIGYDDCTVTVTVDAAGRFDHADSVQCTSGAMFTQVSGHLEGNWASIAAVGETSEGTISIISMLNFEH